MKKIFTLLCVVGLLLMFVGTVSADEAESSLSSSSSSSSEASTSSSAESSSSSSSYASSFVSMETYVSSSSSSSEESRVSSSSSTSSSSSSEVSRSSVASSIISSTSQSSTSSSSSSSSTSKVSSSAESSSSSSSSSSTLPCTGIMVADCTQLLMESYNCEDYYEDYLGVLSQCVDGEGGYCTWGHTCGGEENPETCGGNIVGMCWLSQYDDNSAECNNSYMWNSTFWYNPIQCCWYDEFGCGPCYECESGAASTSSSLESSSSSRVSFIESTSSSQLSSSSSSTSRMASTSSSQISSSSSSSSSRPTTTLTASATDCRSFTLSLFGAYGLALVVGIALLAALAIIALKSHLSIEMVGMAVGIFILLVLGAMFILYIASFCPSLFP